MITLLSDVKFYNTYTALIYLAEKFSNPRVKEEKKETKSESDEKKHKRGKRRRKKRTTGWSNRIEMGNCPENWYKMIWKCLSFNQDGYK